jgi:hypothetical protein
VIAHAENDDELWHAVQMQWEIIEEDDRKDVHAKHHYLACSAIPSADTLLSILAARFAASDFRIMLQSVNMDSSCYSFRGTLRDVAAVSISGKRILT